MEPITYDPEDIVYLNQTDGLRVSPTRGVVHRAHCRTQDPSLRPAVLPWPKYADDDDKACKICRPDLRLGPPPAEVGD
jgi:hypothetical protein